LPFLTWILRFAAGYTLAGFFSGYAFFYITTGSFLAAAPLETTYFSSSSLLSSDSSDDEDESLDSWRALLPRFCRAGFILTGAT
jgi:hypothetical protein